MTREECIEDLKMIGYDGWTVTQDSYEAIQWAIEELAKPSDDASYQHTINELNKVVQEQAEEIRTLKGTIKDFESAIELIGHKLNTQRGE